MYCKWCKALNHNLVEAPMIGSGMSFRTAHPSSGVKITRGPLLTGIGARHFKVEKINISNWGPVDFQG